MAFSYMARKFKSFFNISMTLLKLLLGLLSGSLAVLADAMHSATDGFSSLLGLVTNGLSDPEPDRDHPYGHHKYEAVGALAIAAFILFTAFRALKADFPAHRRLARRVWPVWFYVSVTGVVVYLLISPYY